VYVSISESVTPFIFWCCLVLGNAVDDSWREKGKTSERASTRRMRCKFESRKVSTSPWYQDYKPQSLFLFAQSYPSVLLIWNSLSLQDIYCNPHRLRWSLGWNVHLWFPRLLYDTIQIGNFVPSPRWPEHFEHFTAWWWATNCPYLGLLGSNKLIHKGRYTLGKLHSLSRIRFRVNECVV